MHRHPRNTMRADRRAGRCAVVGLLLSAVAARADYPPPEDAGFHHCVLIYDRDQRAASDLAPYVAKRVDDAPRSWLFDSFLFCMLRTPSGRSTTTGQTRREDWLYHLDRWFTPGRDLAALNAAIADAVPILGVPREKRRVMLSIPHPDRRVTDFGDVDGDGRTEDLSTDVGLRTVLTWYIAEAQRRFAAARPAHLELWGFYWMHESIPPGDEELTRTAASVVHTAGAKLLWIPWFKAAGWDRWQVCGIDVAIMQPNYAFFSKHAGWIRRDRLTLNANLARAHGLGVEIELPMFCNHPATALYLRRYLADGTAQRYGYQGAATAYYLGRDNLERLCVSKEAWQRDLYSALADYVQGKSVPDPDPACEWHVRGRAVPLLRDGRLQDRLELLSAETELPMPTQVNAIDVYLNDPLPGEPWMGRLVADVRHNDNAWKPAGWALCSGEARNSVSPRVVTIPVQTVGRRLRVSLQPSAGKGPVPVSEIIVDCCPPERTGRTVTHMALEAAYTVTPALGKATYGDDGNELTDGVVPTTGFASGGSVGWHGGNVTIAFDLEKPIAVEQVEVHVEGGGYAAVNWPASAVLKTSPSRMPPRGMSGTGPSPRGFAWATASPMVVDQQRTPNAANGHLTFQAQEPIRTRYLTVDLITSGWLMVSEVKIVSDGRNVALGKGYSLAPAPSCAASGAYPDDGKRLTDGRIADRFNRSLLTGWNDDAPRSFTVRLPATDKVSGVTVWTLAGGAYGIRAPNRVLAEISTNGTHWRRIGEARRDEDLVETEGAELRALPYRVRTPGTQATAIRVTVERSRGWTMLSELQVDGQDGRPDSANRP
ncbi:MAG: DUF4855 domain-containing protein [Lentisphaerae bacterium]|nr:DUF4855 domain-containing protein [Lentisphaerota bacterium]